MGKKGPDINHFNHIMNDYVSNGLQSETSDKAQELLGVKSNIRYIEDDTRAGKPNSLLGEVLVIYRDGSWSFAVNSLYDFEENLSCESIQRSSLVVDAGLSAQVDFLSMLNLSLSQDVVASLTIFDQIRGRVEKNRRWDDAIEEWLAKQSAQSVLRDDNVEYVLLVDGFVQKHIVRRNYKKFKGGARGGAYGLNFNGEIYLGNEEIQLDIRYGLSTLTLKRKEAVVRGIQRSEVTRGIEEEVLVLNDEDLKKINILGKAST